MKKVTVIGAGFSGLVSAYYLVGAGFEVEILEASDKAGGLIQTLQTPEGMVETAANAVLNSALVEEMSKTIGLRFVHTKRAAKKRYVWVGGRARRWPLGILGTLHLLKGVSLFAINRKKAKPETGEVVSAWVERVFGRQAARYLIEAALQGIYAGDPEKLSASLIFGRYFEKAQKSRGQRVRPGSVAPRDGMAAWIKALERYLLDSGVKIRYSAALPAMKAVEAGSLVVIATNAKHAARFLESIDPEKAKALRSIEYLPLVTTTVFSKKSDEKTEGFGLLFPPSENRVALGVLKNDFIFENRIAQGSKLHSETWIAGGALRKDLINKSDAEILDFIRSERATVFGLHDEPAAFHLTRWPEALPHYTTELEQKQALLNGPTKNVILIGNYLGDLGLSKLLERASRVPERLQ